jgi:hypothetical protein
MSSVEPYRLAVFSEDLKPLVEDEDSQKFVIRAKASHQTDGTDSCHPCWVVHVYIV